MNTDSYIKAENDNGNFKITIEGEFRNRLWSREFGDIQAQLDDPSILNITVNLEKISWIDPLPIMSIILTLIGKKINDDSININIFLKGGTHATSFLLKYSFLNDAIEKYGINLQYNNKGKITHVVKKGSDITVENKTLTEIYKQIEQENYRTFLGDSHILDTQFIDLNDIVDNISNINNELLIYVRQLLHLHITPQLKLKVEHHRLDETLDRLETILVEVLANIYEHAYTKNQARLTSLFIRYRVGGENLKKLDIMKVHKRAAVKEDQDKVGLQAFFSHNSSDFLEVFILDNGSGLAESYFNKEEIEISSKGLFPKAFKKAFISGVRGQYSDANKSDKRKETEFGGLNFINKGTYCDFICCIGLNQWVHSSFPQHSDPTPILISEVKTPVRGFGAILRLNWLKIGDFDWNKIDKGIFKNQYSNFNSYYMDNFGLPASSLINEEPVGNNIQIKDDRFGEKITKATNIIKKYLKTKDSHEIEFCIYFPAQNLPKNNIINCINDTFGNKKIRLKEKTLVIGDIRPYESIKYQHAIHNGDLTPNFLDNFDFIVLISNRLRVRVLTKNSSGNSFEVNMEMSNKYSTNTDSFGIKPNFSDYISFIRTNDSILLWNKIMELSRKGEIFYVNNDIKWYTNNDETILKGYLNIQKIVDDDRLHPIIENSLFRLYGYEEHIDCIHTDDLVSSLAESLNSYSGRNSLNKKQIKTNIGSVYVSGTTIDHYQDNETPTFLLFIHGGDIPSVEEIKNRNIYSLFLWNQAWIEQLEPSDITYKRVGRTHNIAPHGWKYFPIPRVFPVINGKRINNSLLELSHNKEKISFQNAYIRNPIESYQDFQDTMSGVFSISHNKYGNNHDILDINYVHAVEKSFREETQLAIFLLSEFLLALGNDEESIVTDENYSVFEKHHNKMSPEYTKNHIKRIKNLVKNYINNLDVSFENEDGLIVYPHHYSTGQIIRLIKKYLKIDLHNNIIPLHPLLLNRASTSHLISSFDITNLGLKLVETKSKTITFFDETMIGGSTNISLRHIFDYIGVERIRNIAITDRRRLPFGPSNIINYRIYWRIDIPRLGSKDTCSLCNAINNLKNYNTNSLLHKPTSKRIKNILRIWSASNLYEGSTTRGLEAKYISKTEQKFSIFIDSDTGKNIFDGYKIKLINSVGLSMYIAELTSMTTRDDIATFLERKKFREEAVNIKLEVLSFSLLLFNKDFSKGVVNEISSRLIELLMSSEEESNETAFSLLVLLQINEDVLLKAIRSNLRSTSITLCTDAQVILLYCYTKFKDKDIYKVLQKLDIDLYLSNEIFKNQYSYTKKLVKAVHNDHGDRHHHATYLLYKINTKYDNISKNDILSRSLSEVEGLIELVKKYPTTSTNNVIRGKSDGKLSRKKAGQKLQKLEEMLLESFNPDNNDNQKYLLKLAIYAKKTFEYIEKITSNLAICLYNSDIPNFLCEYGETTEKLKKISDIFKEKNHITVDIITIPGNCTDFLPYNIRVPFDSLVEKEIEYTLDNIKEADGGKIPYEDIKLLYPKLNDVYPDRTNDFFDLFILISFENGFLNIVFINYCLHDKTQDECHNIYNNKERQETIHIRKELKGKISHKIKPIENSNKLFLTTIKLPKL